MRSVLAHACLNDLASSRFAVQSCGWPGQLAREVHPAAIGALASAGIAVPQSVPLGWDRLREQRTAAARFVITLDLETQAVQPPWPGQPDTALWSLPDVASFEDAEQAAHEAIRMLYQLRRRLELFVNLPLTHLNRELVRLDVRDLGSLR